MRRMVWLALAAALAAHPATAQPIDEDLFRVQYLAARTAHLCGVTTAAEALRLSAAIAADYSISFDPRGGPPRIAPSRMAKLRAELDRAPATPKQCESAPRYVPHLQAEYPPGGKVERNPPGSPAWDARIIHSANASVVARARACGLIDPPRAAALLQRSEAVPALAHHWSATEIADATATGVQHGRGRQNCTGLRDMLALVEERIAEAETGWNAAD